VNVAMAEENLLKSKDGGRSCVYLSKQSGLLY